MSLEDLGNIGELVAAIGVIASLIYLAIQIRQNTQSVRSSAVQASVRDTTEIIDLLVRIEDRQRDLPVTCTGRQSPCPVIKSQKICSPASIIQVF